MDLNHDWYTNPKWRDAFTADATRDLSKTGSLSANQEVFHELAGVLPKSDIIALYNNLRDSRRAESEWRAEFLALFPTVQVSDLPPVVYDQPPPTPSIRKHLNVDNDDDIPF